MIKVLIISHHFPPDNIVASRRIEAYCRYLHEFGIHPTVVTTRFEKEYINKESDVWKIKYHNKDEDALHEEFDNYTVYHLPRPYVKSWSRRIPGLRTLKDIAGYFRGYFGKDAQQLSNVYRKFLRSHLANKKYDLLLGIYSPQIGPHMAHEFGTKFNLPFAIDFRDLWDNRVLDKTYGPSLNRRFRNYWMKKYFGKWLADARFFTITSQPWLNEIKKLTDTEGHIVQNGYFELNTEQKVKNSRFTISSVGTIYPLQDISIFIQAIQELYESHPTLKLKIHMVGLKEHNYNGITQIFGSSLPTVWTEISTWVARDRALEIMNQSDLLYYPAQSIRGWVSAKLYEYIASGNNILVCPGDNDVSDELIKETGTGAICSTAEEAKKYLLEKYNQWLENGHCKSSRDEHEVAKYSRRNQVRIFSDVAKKELKFDRR